MTELKVSTPRPKRAKRGKRVATIEAHGATFANLTAHRGIGFVSQEQAYPFKTLALKKHYATFDSQAQSYIAAALATPYIANKINRGNVGTGPELVVLGLALAKGYTPGRTLLYQDTRITGYRKLHRAFVVDISIVARGGRLYLINIDGNFFHSSTELEILNSAFRDRKLAQTGIVVTIPGDTCLQAMTLNAFLVQHGVPL